MEIDNKNISPTLKSSLPFYGVMYIFVLTAVIVAGYVYTKNIDYIAESDANVLPKPLDSSAAMMLDVVMKKGTTSPPVDVFKLSVSTPEEIAKGKGLYDVTCATCHGPEGKGDGPAGATLNPKPRNFHELTGWTNGPNFEAMYITLQEGITNRGMASYANMTPEDRIAIITYLRTMNPNYPPIKQENLKILDDTFSLSKGVKMPSIIPVKLAKERILAGYKVQDSLFNKMSADITVDTTAGAKLFRSKVRNQVKALHFLSDNMKWNENRTDLVKMIMSDPYSAGFKTEISTMTEDEWNMLFAYLKSVFSTNKV